MTKGKDLSLNPVRRTIMFDKPREMIFNNAAFREAEIVYETIYEKDWGVDDIIMDLHKRKYRAIEAFAYAGLKAAGDDISWKEFDEKVFSFAGLEDLADVMNAAVEEMLPTDDGDREAEGN